MRFFILLILFVSSVSIESQEFDFIKHFEGTCQSVDLNSNYAYFNSGPNINILDISNPNEISLVNTFHTGYYFPVDINYSNGYLFICSGVKGFIIYDVSNPLQPEFISWVDWPYCDYGFESIIQDSIILVDEGNEESISIFDITDLNNPSFLSRIEFPVNQNDAYALNKNILYGFEVSQNTNWDGYLRGYDISDPSDPQLTKELKLCDNGLEPYPDDMLVYNYYHLLVAIDDTIKIFDISISDTILYQGQFASPFSISKLQINGDTLYTLCPGHGIQLINISELFNPTFLGIINQSNPIDRFKMKNNLSITSLGYKGLELIDIEDLSNPLQLFENNQTDNVQAIEIQNNIAYMGMEEKGLQLVDISNPINPVYLGNIDTLKRIDKFEYYSGYLYCRVDNEYNTIYIIDVGDPSSPEELNQINTEFFINDFKVQNGILYLTENGEWLKFFDISNPEMPIEVASYQQDGHRIAVDSNLMVLSFYTPSSGGVLKTFKLGPNYSITNCDEICLGYTATYNPCNIDINFPFLNIGTRKGAVIAELDNFYNISICDEITYEGSTTFTNTMTSDDDHLYLGGHYNGMDKILIIDIQNPYNIFLTESIDRYCLDFALKQKILYTSESQNGYSIYGDLIVGVPEQIFPSDQIEIATYPNPFINYMIVDFSIKLPKNSALKVYNTNSFLIGEFDVSCKKKLKLNTEQYENGMYILYLIINHQSKSYKTIKLN